VSEMGHAPINASAYRLSTSRLLKSHNSPCSNGNSLCSNGNGSSAPTIATSAQFYRCSNGGTLTTPT